MRYICPVCGFADLENPPRDHVICPSCGTQFGYDDVTRSYEKLRDAWVSRGARWFSGYPPPLWNPWRQLAEARLFPFSVEVHLSQSFVAYGASVAQAPEIFVHFQ